LEILSQQKFGKKEKALVLCYCKSNLSIFILFILGFELLVFRYTNISSKIRSTSSNKMACTMYSWMKYSRQTASNGAKVNQHPQMHQRGWMVFGRCMDMKLFFVRFVFPQLTSQWLRALKLGFIQLWMASKQANGGDALLRPAVHTPAPGFGPVSGGYHLLGISVG
jgi:hypothetical protein